MEYACRQQSTSRLCGGGATIGPGTILLALRLLVVHHFLLRLPDPRVDTFLLVVDPRVQNQFPSTTLFVVVVVVLLFYAPAVFPSPSCGASV